MNMNWLLPFKPLKFFFKMPWIVVMMACVMALLIGLWWLIEKKSQAQEGRDRAAMERDYELLKLIQTEERQLKASLFEWQSQMSRQGSEIFNQEKLTEVRLLDLQTRIEELQQTHAHAEGSVLPFHIESLDLWNGQPYVHVVSKKDGAMSRDLARFETLNGWKVMEIDLQKASVTFENHDHQVQKIHLHFEGREDHE